MLRKQDIHSRDPGSGNLASRVPGPDAGLPDPGSQIPDPGSWKKDPFIFLLHVKEKVPFIPFTYDDFLNSTTVTMSSVDCFGQSMMA